MRLITTTAMTISTEKTICRIKQQKKTSMDYVGVNLNGFIRYLTGAHDCHEEKKNRSNECVSMSMHNGYLHGGYCASVTTIIPVASASNGI